MIKITEIRSEHELNTEGLYKKAGKILGVKRENLSDLRVIKRSLDARKRNAVLYVYSVTVKAGDEERILRRSKDGRVSLYREKEYSLPEMIRGAGKSLSPVIAGFGPAGMFASLYLSYLGLDPIILERGDEVDERQRKVEEFWESGKLDLNSNVQFGEGGAGTFSDGKLTTGIRDKENRGTFVLKSLVKYGAPADILIDSKPHIGSDCLKKVVKNLRADITEHGGEVRFCSRLSGFETDETGHIRGIYINDSEYLKCSGLILATGHSARDTLELLKNKGVIMEPKSFAVGLRVQHLQELINRAMYGNGYDKGLRPADYKLTFSAGDNRGVYSFCMCPGGYVINSSSEEGELSVNGMSYSGRNGNNANSAIVVTVTPEDYIGLGYGRFGELSGMEFQRELERRAFLEGNGNIPCQRLEDFIKKRISTSFGEVKPEFKGRYDFGNLRSILPDHISLDIISAFSSFGERIQGFDSPDALLSGVESRTSSPVRILRNEDLQSSVPGIYPAGEGAGYAGGIMSAAIDGLKCAEKVAAERAKL